MIVVFESLGHKKKHDEKKCYWNENVITVVISSHLVTFFSFIKHFNYTLRFFNIFFFLFLVIHAPGFQVNNVKDLMMHSQRYFCLCLKKLMVLYNLFTQRRPCFPLTVENEVFFKWTDWILSYRLFASPHKNKIFKIIKIANFEKLD